MAAAARRKTKKRISNTAKGAYYKGRSKKYLLARGYAVANMEEMRMIYGPPKRRGGRPELVRAVKQDQFGADLHGIRLEPTPESVYVQVKGGVHAKTGLSAARRMFRRFPFPDFVRREIHVWLPRARLPEIVDCSNELHTTGQELCEVALFAGQKARTSRF